MKALAVTGFAVGAIWLLRRKGSGLPAVVHVAAARELARARINPCRSDGEVGADDYADLYIRQKEALIAIHGSAVEHSCIGVGVDVCFPVPSKRIPALSAGCAVAVAQQWIDIAGRLVDNDDTPGSLRGDLTELGNQLALARQLARALPAASEFPTVANYRLWATIARLKTALAGVHINHGDAEEEALDELPGDIKRNAAELAGDTVRKVAGAALEVGAQVISTGPGALIALGAIVYLAVRP